MQLSQRPINFELVTLNGQLAGALFTNDTKTMSDWAAKVISGLANNNGDDDDSDDDNNGSVAADDDAFYLSYGYVGLLVTRETHLL